MMGLQNWDLRWEEYDVNWKDSFCLFRSHSVSPLLYLNYVKHAVSYLISSFHRVHKKMSFLLSSNVQEIPSCGNDFFKPTATLSWINKPYFLVNLTRISSPWFRFLQLDTPQKSYTLKQVSWYGFRWVLSLFLMEIMTHFFYYNAFAIRWV